MPKRFTPSLSNMLAFALTTSLLLAGTMGAVATAEELLSRSPERGGVGLELQLNAGDTGWFQSFGGKPLREDLKKLDERLSIIVTDKASTSAITFSEIMQKLADDMRVDKLTLFQRWWGTAKDTSASFCNSATQINGFPYQCPRAEGDQAVLNPFDCANACNGYTAIAVSNRFDLADKDRGQHCGEFRIVFARNSGFGAAQNCHFPEGKRNLIIFEALVPNPRPPQSPVKPAPDNIFVNLAGCRPIVEFWLDLSEPSMSTTARGTALRHFFLEGLPEHNIGPVVDARHYAGGPASGQIRTNQLMQPNWTLREFKTYGGRIIPVTVKSNPGNALLRQDPRNIELADYLVRKATLDNLRGLNSPKGQAGERSIYTFAFGLTVPGVDHLNSFESQAELPDEGDVVTAFNGCRMVPCRGAELIESKMTKALTDEGSSLRTVNIIHRVGTQTCAGCHHYSNGDKNLNVDCPQGWPDRLCFVTDEAGVEVRRGIWPSTLPDGAGFTHVSESNFENGTNGEVFDLGKLNAITPEGLRRIRPERISHLDYRGPNGDRYKISETLKLVLMPPRFENMVLYLNEFKTSP